MLEARDWVLRNVLYLDPTQAPFRSADGVSTPDPSSVVTEGLETEARENESSWLQTFNCRVDVGRKVSDFKVRCTTVPESAILLCKNDGVQLKALKIAGVSAAFRKMEKIVLLTFINPTQPGVEIAVEFEFKTGRNCSQFSQALKGLFDIQIIDALDENRNRKTFTNVNDMETKVNMDILIINGSGTFGKRVCN